MQIAIKKLNTLRFFWRVINDLIGGRGIRNEISLPIKIGELEFVQSILEDKKNNKFQYGIYKDSAGKEYFAKQLYLKDPGIDEYWLRNEISVYSTFTKLYEKKEETIRKEYPSIYIPKLAAVVDDKTRLLFVVEKISGKTLFDVPMNERIFRIEEVIKYFRFINKIHDFKKDIPTKRSFFHILAMLPLASLGAMRNHPNQWKKILYGLKEIFVNLPFLLRQKDMQFIHRDIGYSNILVGENGMRYVIDFELSSYMHPMWETVQIVAGCWKKEGFNEAFSKSEEMIRIMGDNKLKKTYKLFSIYCGIHILATHGKNVPIEKANAGKRYLDYAIKL